MYNSATKSMCTIASCLAFSTRFLSEHLAAFNACHVENLVHIGDPIKQ